MKSSAFVSICIPTYNQINYLKNTLDSISIQSFKDFEVIITDDSTTDAVHSLVKNYESVFKIIYFKNPKPLGSPANWNKGLSLASGNLIKFMHHDDWFSQSESLFQFVQVFKDERIDFVFCNSEIRNIAENTITYNFPSKSFIDQIRKDPKILFNQNRIGAPSAMMYRKNKELFDERMKYLVDVDFYIRMLSNHTFVHVNEALIVNTSHHPGQVTASSMNKETQVGEYTYLYNKVFKGRLPSIKLSWFFIWLFRTHKIASLKEINTFMTCLPEPLWYFKLLIRIANLNLK